MDEWPYLTPSNASSVDWSNPTPENRPEAYVDRPERSRMVVEQVRRCCPDRDSTILELGCNVGRYLWHLQQAGYTRLTGVDVNAEALRLAGRFFPDLRAHWVHDLIEDYGARQRTPFDVVFSLAVLSHISSTSLDFLGRLQCLTKRYFIAVEDEFSESDRHFPRNYGAFFSQYGFQEVAATRMESYADTGLDANFWLRVLEKAPSESMS